MSKKQPSQVLEGPLLSYPPIEVKNDFKAVRIEITCVYCNTQHHIPGAFLWNNDEARGLPPWMCDECLKKKRVKKS